MASDDHIADSDEEVSSVSSEDILGVNQEGQSRTEPRIVRLDTQGGDRDVPLERVADAFWLQELVGLSD